MKFRVLAAGLLLHACGAPDPVQPPEPAAAEVGAELAVGSAQRMQAELERAESRFLAQPKDEDAIVWYGRRLAYLGRLDEAIEVYSHGLALNPMSPRLLRHRGHRRISQREFVLAREDLRRASRLVEGRADQVEADGMPNAAGRPRSTLNGNIAYHLALACFLLGDFEESAQAWRHALELSTNDDTLVAVTHWYFMTLRRLGEERAAQALLGNVGTRMDILENRSYHEVLLLKKDLRQVEDVLATDSALSQDTVGFGVAHWFWRNGEAERARQMLEEIVARPRNGSFGRIAAEVELARWDTAGPR